MNRYLAYLIVLIAAFCDALNPLRRGRMRLANAVINRTVISGVRSLKFARNGVDNGGSPVSSSAQPAADAAVYESLGTVESAAMSISEETLKIINASGGSYRLTKKIPLKQEIALQFKMQEVNQVTFEMKWLLAALAAGATPVIGTEYRPMMKATDIIGWLEMKISDQTATNIELLYLWVSLSISAYPIGEKDYTYELNVEVLDNALNTFELDALAAN